MTLADELQALRDQDVKAMNDESMMARIAELEAENTSLRAAHTYVAKQLDLEENDNDFWRKVAASVMADRDRQGDRILELEAENAALHESKAADAAEWLVNRAELANAKRHTDRFMKSLETCSHDDCARRLRPIQTIINGLLGVEAVEQPKCVHCAGEHRSAECPALDGWVG